MWQTNAAFRIEISFALHYLLIINSVTSLISYLFKQIKEVQSSLKEISAARLWREIKQWVRPGSREWALGQQHLLASSYQPGAHFLILLLHFHLLYRPFAKTPPPPTPPSPKKIWPRNDTHTFHYLQIDFFQEKLFFLIDTFWFLLLKTNHNNKATAIDNRLSIARYWQPVVNSYWQPVQFSCNIMLTNIYKNSCLMTFMYSVL